jgi:NAD(P)-dependent dehydrogenase (short-subunit alcohol dehydrogenase family)
MAEEPFERWRLNGRVALVTGASTGLGARFAEVLHDAGAHVIVTARRDDLLKELARRCGERTDALAGDIVDAHHRRALIDLVARYGRLDILVNNAGVCDTGSLEDQTLDDLRHVVDVNLIAVVELSRLAIPLLRAARRASVINVSSMYGVVASKGAMPGYNATKAALLNLTRHLAALLGLDGIRVNALAPGYFPTELTGFLTDPTLVEAVRDNTALGRAPEVDELDGPLLFLASDASSYVTGHTLVIDGGWTST